ncbi:MAG: redox-regulated ATPase YchF [Nitrospinaceae bacterium]|nr:redox-regulated ATPase YchF [Nitrospinaceae bacterium]
MSVFILGVESLKIGIIGIASSGKTTLFNALTGGEANTGGYGASQVNVGIGRVADPRVDAMSEMFQPKKTTYATVEFADVPGRGEGRDGASTSAEESIPQALEGADALLLVLRAFDDPGVPHPRQSVDPARDLGDMRLDLILRDLSVVERRVERLKKSLAKKKDPAEAAEFEVLEKIQTSLEEGVSILAQDLPEKVQTLLRGYGFLSAKPVLAVLNVGEDKIGESAGALGVEAAEGEAPPVVVGAQLEEELAQLDEEEQAVFLADYGLERPARDRVIQASFALLGLECFLTVGEDEVRAWPIRRGTSALKAAGSIHSDLERGFIRAEVIGYDDFVAAGSMAAARDKGVLRIEGKDYEVQDGEIMHVRFNV